MNNDGMKGETLRLFGFLLILAAGLFGAEAIVGFFWMDLVPLDVGTVLTAWAVLVVVTGVLSVGSRTVRTHWPRWHSWIFGIGIGVTLPLKLGIFHPASLGFTVVLTAFVVVRFSSAFGDSDFSWVLPAVFLLLLGFSTDWLRWLEPSLAGEVALGSLSAAVLGAFLVVLYRDPVRLCGFVKRRPRLMTGVALALLVPALLLWGTVDSWDKPPSYFSGTVPEVSGPAGTSTQDLPNIILISVDTLRADIVPPHAENSLELPALRTLQEDSVRYSQMISTSSWTLPAHASLFTGLLPMEHGAVKDRRSRIYASVPSYVQQLRRLGYRTGAFTDGAWVHPEFGFGRGFQVYWVNQETDDRSDPTFRPGVLSFGVSLTGTDGEDSECSRRGTERFLRDFCSNVQKAKRWIQDGRDGSRPFFMFLHTYRVHDYFQAYPKDVRRLKREHPVQARSLFEEQHEFDDFQRPLSDTSTRIFRRRLSEIDEIDYEAVFRELDRTQPGLSQALKHWVVLLPPSSWDMFKALPPSRQKGLIFYFGFVGEEVRRRPIELTLRRMSLPLVLMSPTDRLEDYLRILRERGGFTARQIDTLRELTRRQLEGWRHLYRYGLEAVDRDLGDFLGFLRSKDLYEDSLILFTSDHGEGFSLDPLVIAHGSREFLDRRGQLHDDVIRVPFWMKLPGSDRSHETITEPRQIFEVFPLLFREMGVTGYRPHGHPFGTDPGSDDPSLPGRDLTVSSRSEMDGSDRLTPQYAVRSERYKLVRHWNSGLLRFFRLPQEAGEAERHVLPEEVPADERARLHEHMDRLLEHYRSLPDPYRDREFRKSSEIRQTLRGLGYMQ